MQAISAKAYAKINLCLNITGKRADGYHLLDGVMLPVSIYDTVRTAKADDLFAACSDARIPSGADNSACKIAQSFFEYTGIRGGADIFIQKRIPAEAGLGGGSSDAACVLRSLNILYETHLSNSELTQIAAANGADTAFFLSDGAKRAQGIGENLTPVAYNFSPAILLIKPLGGVNTAEAFRLFHQTTPKAADTDACIQALMENDIAAFSAASRNMLEAAGITLCPAIQDAIESLKHNGALFAQMTGSGSAVYGLFESEAKAAEAAAVIANSGQFEYVLPVRYISQTFEPVLRIHA
jgi:4-diphosphocytidyl-2-C-methyl-D-erythritol kinase